MYLRSYSFNKIARETVYFKLRFAGGGGEKKDSMKRLNVVQ